MNERTALLSERAECVWWFGVRELILVYHLKGLVFWNFSSSV